MNCSECALKLNDFVDAELSATDAHAVTEHLASCAECRDRVEALRALVANVASLPKAIMPQVELWPAVHAKIQQVTSNESPGVFPARRPASIVQWFLPLAAAASVALLATLVERSPIARDTGPGWSVASLAGAPQVGAKTFSGEAKFHVGQWLKTDANSRAKVSVASIGEVTVDANSRLRLTGTTATEHRVELARGKLSALIWAPPRLFFVDTPSATAVDLGCAYTLEVDEHGNGELQVSTGYVALEHGGRESIIPSGAMCLTRRGSGPGTPFVADAPAPLRQAIARFDFVPGAAAVAAMEIVSLARAEDTLTLWHLLGRTTGPQLAAAFDALATFQAPPAEVTREGILRGDLAMRRAWGTAMGFGTF